MLMWHHEDTYYILHEQRSILMSSVSQVERAMQTVFSQANALARQTGFVQRASKLTGERFVQTLVTAWLNNPQATREALAQMAASLGVAIPILQHFTAIMVLDSTVIVLSDELASVWRGCGGNTDERAQAAVK